VAASAMPPYLAKRSHRVTAATTSGWGVTGDLGHVWMWCSCGGGVDGAVR